MAENIQVARLEKLIENLNLMIDDEMALLETYSPMRGNTVNCQLSYNSAADNIYKYKSLLEDVQEILIEECKSLLETINMDR